MAGTKDWDENRKVDAPEAVNLEQEDEGSQAQTLAEEALAAHRRKVRSDAAGQHSVKPSGGDGGDMPDLVDHIEQMESSGQIDNSAYRGERNDDDDEDSLGRGGLEPGTKRGAP